MSRDKKNVGSVPIQQYYSVENFSVQEGKKTHFKMFAFIIIL